jgi:hypothetical protein
MQILVIITIILAALTGLYAMTIQGFKSGSGSSKERFMDYITAPTQPGLDGTDVNLAAFPEGQQGLLVDCMTAKVGLSALGAGECAAGDHARQLELGGQYVQRTNNYRRSYPDNCSAPLSEFVTAMYAPKAGVGITVPCDGQC